MSLALVASLGVWWAVRNGEEAREALDCSVPEANGFGDAGVLARACETEVEVLGERTPWQTSWATPDGSSRLEMATVPVRAEVDGEWVPVNSELVVATDGWISVAAPVFPLHLNPGGEAGKGLPLGTIERDGHIFKVWFPIALPVAEVDETQVVYSLGGGIRLVVTVNVDTTAFLPVIELATPEAAERFLALLESSRATRGGRGTGMDLEFATELSEGLTLGVDEAFQVTAVDEAGDEQFFAPPPIMWDSSGGKLTLGSEVTEVGTGDRTISPSDGDAIAAMPTSLVGNTLIVSPSVDMLTSSATVWPVYIDPTFGAHGAAERIAVRTGEYTSTLYNWTNISSTSLGQGTGYCSETSSCIKVFRQRLVWEFQGLSTIANLAGSDIQSAQFRVNGEHSYNCTARTTTLYRTAEISASSNWSSVGLLQTLGSRTESQRASCGTNGWRNFDATQGFVWAADSNASAIGFALIVDETSMLHWKRFTHDATISVTYNRAPDWPTSLQFTFPSGPACVTGAARPSISTTTPTLSAIGSDPDGGTVMLNFVIYSISPRQGFSWSSGYQAPISSGARGSLAVPSGLLQDGKYYMWGVAASDGTLTSPVSGFCEFIVDTTAPQIPTVTPVAVGVQAVYYQGMEFGGVGQLGAFTLSRGASGDVKAFDYGFNAPTMPNTATVDGSGNAVVTYQPNTTGPVSLTVRSRDAAGNFSPTVTYTFAVSTPTEDGIWTFDEGSGTTAADSAGTPPRPLALLGGVQWGDGPHTLFDSRDGDRALVFDGVDDRAASGGPVVETSTSFAVSAHVLIDASRVGQSQSFTALSQDGVSDSGFRLGYTAVCPGMPSGCWSFTMPDTITGASQTAVLSPEPVKGGEWTHLVGEYDANEHSMTIWVCEVGTPQNPAIGEPMPSEIARTATPWSASGAFRVGRGLVAGAYAEAWPGSIDNVHVFAGEVISEAESKIRRLCQGAEATDFPTGDLALDPTTTLGE